ncbi:hypothetical protein GQ42DRAFT_179258 [Ramicandelaber brevisporus]|nr:hypothetical protein GQ42DRAFT_179258 [Ramicandelaber brevisporus]
MTVFAATVISALTRHMLVCLLAATVAVVYAAGPMIHNEVAERAQLQLSRSPRRPPLSTTRGSASASRSSSRHLSRLFSQQQTNRDNDSNAEDADDVDGAIGAEAFIQIMRSNPEFLQAGAFFPDWGYGCMSGDDFAEDAHWPPFYAAAVDYIVAKYSISSTSSSHGKVELDSKAHGLIAFLFGTVSHGVADVLWHGIAGMPDGLVHLIKRVHFNGNYGDAHSLVDPAPEFILNHRTSSDHLVGNWKVPIEDLINIYDLLYKTTTDASATRKATALPSSGSIRSCMLRGYAAIQSLRRFGNLLFPNYAKETPLLVDKLEDYHLGGLNDMAAWTRICWDTFAEWLLTGKTPLKTTTMCRIFNKANVSDRHPPVDTHQRNSGYNRRTNRRMHVQQSMAAKFDHVALLRAVDINIDSETDDGVLTVGRVDGINKHQRRVARSLSKKPAVALQCGDIASQFGRSSMLHINVPYARLGHAVSSGEFTGLTNAPRQLVISAPFFQRVHETSSAEFNGHLVPHGAVFIVDPSRLTNPSGSHDIESHATIRLDPPPQTVDAVTSTRRALSARFGYSVVVMDWNGDGIDDLAVGAPGASQVFIYLGTRGVGLPSLPSLTISLAESSDTIEESAGETLHAVKVGPSNTTLLLVGDPLHNRVVAFSPASIPPNHIGVLGYKQASFNLTESNLAQDARYSSVMASTASINGTDVVLAVSAPGFPVHKSFWPSPKDSGDPLVGKIFSYRINFDDETQSFKVQDELEFTGLEINEQLGDSMILLSPTHPLTLNLSKSNRTNSSAPSLPTAAAAAAATVAEATIIAGLPSWRNEKLRSSSSELNSSRDPPAREDKSTLVPGRQTGWQAGAVFVHLLNSTTPSNLPKLPPPFNQDPPQPAISVPGQESSARFGSSLALSLDQSSVWIGEPYSDYENGHLWKLSLLDSARNELKCFELRNRDGSGSSKGPAAMRFGTSIHATDVYNTKRESLVVSAPHSSHFVHMGGSVTVFT